MIVAGNGSGFDHDLRSPVQTEDCLKKSLHSHQGPAPLRLRIRAAAESRLRSGHPWLYADSVVEQNREGLAGELAVVYDRKDHFLAIGLFEPNSPIRLRVLHTGKPQRIDPEWWHQRLDRAIARRQGLFDHRTNGFRWINGESDGWPALVLDRYASTLVLKLYSPIWLTRLPDVSSWICAKLRPERLVLRLSRNLSVPGTKSSWTDGQVLVGPTLHSPVEFLESGLRFEADVVQGQKTGFFLDQRENRREVQKLAAGRRVLNAFSFSGAFSVYAASGGASSATDLDISAHALAGAKRNFALNRAKAPVSSCAHELVQTDAFDWLEQNSQRKFDMVLLDPPSLAKRESERLGAIRAYARLATAGIKHLGRGGILLACSCSAHVSQDEFFSAIRQAASKSHRHFEEFQTTDQPPDHPAAFEEAKYLKAIYLRF